MIAGGLSGSRLKLLKRCHFFCLPAPDELILSACEDFLIEEVPFPIREISFTGYSLRSKGLETIRQALTIVTLDSMIVQMVAGMM